MTGKWTPGPWSFEAICFDRRIPIGGGRTVHGRPYNVALVNRPGSARAGEDKANAALIASAPTMAETLEIIANASERAETMFGGKMSEVTRVFEHITRVSRQALSQALGEGL